jgi:hypothetical protein
MSGKGELVKYTSLTAKTPQERAKLKQDIDAIIEAASGTITVQALVEALPQDIVADTIRKLEQAKGK